MTGLALPVVAAAILALPPQRTFWHPEPGPGIQPVETRVPASLAAEGRFIAVYREQGYRFSARGEEDETRQIAEAVDAFDRLIYPRLVEVIGPCPDLDGNGKVLLLVTHLTGQTTLFWRFDAMSATEAEARGLHSNQGEVIYASFARQGNHTVWTVRELAGALAELLQFADDPGATDWGRLIAGYAPYLCELAGPRLLWGDDDPDGTSHRAGDPWTDRGSSLLTLDYLRERLGDAVLHRLAADGEEGLGVLGEFARERGGPSPAGMAADAALAMWLNDPTLSQGRFHFRTVSPPRPSLAASIPASRPASGRLEVGVGGAVFLQVTGEDQPAQPLALQGDPSLRWMGRGVHLRHLGPDEEIPVHFGPDGAATVDLGPLHRGDHAVVAAVPVPPLTATFDRRRVGLLWGLGWVPRWPEDQGRAELNKVFAKHFPSAGALAVDEVAAVLDRLCGLDTAVAGPERVVTRYAWAPESQRVISLLHEEAQRRGLSARAVSFAIATPTRLSQQWTNLLIELPGSDPRRWPVVIAAHWDAARVGLANSYLHARNVHDDASGVVVALEAAHAIASSSHRAPVVVAFLAGGYHGAAGARALLDHLAGNVAAWIALDGVGIPDPFPLQLTVHAEVDRRLPQMPQVVERAVRGVGLRAQIEENIETGHSGVSLARGQGIATVLLRTHMVATDAVEADLPASVERGYASPVLMVLLARAVADAALDLASPQ